MRRRILAFIAGAVLLPAVAAGSAAADDPLVQGAGQSASSQQTAGSSATSTQSSPANTNISVRIGSPGDGGVVTQTNGSSAISVAGTANGTTQQAAQQGGAPGVQTAGQSATNGQTANSTANSTQDHPKNTNISVRIMSPGDDGSVTQTNDSSAKSAAGNKNSTTQSAGQSGGGVQNATQDAANKQSATSDATSTQKHPSNVNIPVRIYSDGDNGSVTQTNSSSAKSAAGNKNETTQTAEQGSGSSKSAPVRDACGGGCGDHGGPSVQDAEQSSSSSQSANSSATSEQDHPSNVNIPVRIGSSGYDGSVKQVNSSSAVSAAGNKNTTDQTVDQSAGGSSGGPAVQYADQKAGNWQDATSSATSHQSGASNANYPVRIHSPGGGGSVTQVNGSFAGSVAGNKNDTTQNAAQDAGSVKKVPIPVRDECGDKCDKPSYDGCGEKCDKPYDGCRDKCDGGSGPVVQDVKQSASNDQKADSSAESTQCCAKNTNAPVRIKSEGDDGDVKQANLSGAFSAAGNKNETNQYATQDAGSGPVEMVKCKDGCGHGDGGPVVQQANQWASNDQSAHSSADSTQKGASNSNAPVRIGSPGGGGSVTQVNGSLAVSAAGNKNSTDQTADQSAGGSGGGVTVQALGQKAVNWQDAGSHATSEQDGASNDNSPVRIKSAGSDGDVTQANLSGAFSVAGNKNDTTQNASQSAGGLYGPAVREKGCDSCGGDGATVQGIGQWASSEQSADSSADSTQKGACNTNSPVRIKSRGDDGDVKQINASAAKSAAGNDNETSQSADQAAGWGGVNVQALGQKADNGQGAGSRASSQQYDPSNANDPVRLHSAGGGGSVWQINASEALSAAGNRNSTCQRASQGSGGAPRCVKKARKPVHEMKVD